MGGEWRDFTADEFCSSVRDGTHDSPKPVAEGRFLVTSRHITSGRLDLSSAYLISEEDFANINARSRVDQWDVLISMIGTVGEPCLVRDVPDFAIKNIGLFKSRDEISGKWLYYYLRSREAQQQIRELSRGTTQAYVPLGALRSLTIPAPSDADEMRAIVKVLSTLDDKIELNRRMNETLEAMARALFKSWFVDFDPVRAKAEGRDTGLPKEIADLFPARLVESELGEVPEGWVCTTIDRVTIVITKGTTPTKSQNYVTSGVRFVRVNAIDGHGNIVDDQLLYIDASTDESLARSRLLEGDILFSIAGTIGRAALVERWLLPANTNQAVAILRPDTSMIEHELLFLYCTSEGMQRFFMERIVHAVQANLSLGIIKTAPLVIPNTRTQQSLVAPISQLMSRVRNNRRENHVLTAIRDALLPRLISGDIRVKDAEKFVEARA